MKTTHKPRLRWTPPSMRPYKRRFSSQQKLLVAVMLDPRRAGRFSDHGPPPLVRIQPLSGLFREESTLVSNTEAQKNQREKRSISIKHSSSEPLTSP